MIVAWASIDIRQFHENILQFQQHIISIARKNNLCLMAVKKKIYIYIYILETVFEKNRKLAHFGACGCGPPGRKRNAADTGPRTDGLRNFDKIFEFFAGFYFLHFWPFLALFGPGTNCFEIRGSKLFWKNQFSSKSNFFSKI